MRNIFINLSVKNQILFILINHDYYYIKLIIMLKEPFIVKFIKTFFCRRFLFARLSRIWPIGSVLNKLYFEGDEIYYLPKESTIELDVGIESPGSVVLPSDMLERLIDDAGDHFLMNYCICRTSNKCKDYPRELGCLFLGGATRTIDRRFGRPVSKEEAKEHLRKCREAGLVHLIGRNKLDSSWLSARPGERLLTICNCCPCCCLWMMLPNLRNDLSEKVQKMPGVEVLVNGDCSGCGECVASCFVKAIDILDGRARIGDGCRGCGRCADTCPEGAIEVALDGRYDPAGLESRIRDIVDIR